MLTLCRPARGEGRWLRRWPHVISLAAAHGTQWRRPRVNALWAVHPRHLWKWWSPHHSRPQKSRMNNHKRPVEAIWSSTFCPPHHRHNLAYAKPPLTACHSQPTSEKLHVTEIFDAVPPPLCWRRKKGCAGYAVRQFSEVAIPHGSCSSHNLRTRGKHPKTSNLQGVLLQLECSARPGRAWSV